MKSIMKFLAIGLLTFLSLTVFAQRGGGNNKKNLDPQELAERMTQRMNTELALTANQEAQVARINLDFANRMTTAGEDRDARKALKTEHNTALKSVLTPEQATKLDNMKKKGGKGKAKGSKNRGSDNTSTYNNNRYESDDTRYGQNDRTYGNYESTERGYETNDRGYGRNETTNRGGGNNNRSAERIAMLTEALNLTTYQQEQLSAINMEFEEEKAIIRNNNNDRTTVRAQMEEARLVHQNNIKSILTNEQLVAFEAMPQPGNDRGSRGEGRKSRRSK